MHEFVMDAYEKGCSRNILALCNQHEAADLSKITCP